MRSTFTAGEQPNVKAEKKSPIMADLLEGGIDGKDFTRIGFAHQPGLA